MDDSIVASEPSFSNLVVKTNHDSNLNLTVLFELVPIVKIDRCLFDETKKKISYFGHEGIFISVRHNLKSRGLRKPMKVKSFSDLDIQYLGKNFHIKTSSKSLNIVGGVNIKTSEKVCEILYSHFKQIESIWSNFRKLDDQIIRNTISWYKNTKGDFDKLTSLENKELAEMLDILIDKEYDNIDERVSNIYSCINIPLYTSEPEMKSLSICNSVYDYRLPSKISLAEKSSVLHELGYNVSFHNWIVVKHIKASWTSLKGTVFSFSIQNVGTIKQNSYADEEESIEMYQKLVTDLGFKPYYKGAIISLKKPQASISTEKTLRTVKILSEYFSF